MTNHATNNPFEFKAELNNTAGTRRLDYTATLISTSNQRATELMQTVAARPELHELASKMMSNGDPSDLIELINTVFDEETLKADALILAGCDEDQADRLLESRRSDRSKTKKKGLNTSAVVCRNYISCMYAEMLIRIHTGKPYVGMNLTDFDESDVDAVGRRIKSLQSKACRLRKTAAFVKPDADELEAVTDEIARLNTLRPMRTAAAGPKKLDMSQLSPAELIEALSKLDLDELPADVAEIIRAKLNK